MAALIVWILANCSWQRVLWNKQFFTKKIAILHGCLKTFMTKFFSSFHFSQTNYCYSQNAGMVNNYNMSLNQDTCSLTKFIRKMTVKWTISHKNAIFLPKIRLFKYIVMNWKNARSLIYFDSGLYPTFIQDLPLFVYCFHIIKTY